MRSRRTSTVDPNSIPAGWPTVLHMMKTGPSHPTMTKTTIQNIARAFEAAVWTPEVKNMISVAIIIEQIVAIYDEAVHSDAHQLIVNDIFKIVKSNKLLTVVKNKAAIKRDLCLVLRCVMCKFPAWGIFGPACTAVIAYAQEFLRTCTNKDNLSWFASHVCTPEGRDFIANHSAIEAQSFVLSAQTQLFIAALGEMLHKNGATPLADTAAAWCCTNKKRLQDLVQEQLQKQKPIAINIDMNARAMFVGPKTRLFSETLDNGSMEHAPRTFGGTGAELPFSLMELGYMVDNFYTKRMHCVVVATTTGADEQPDYTLLRKLSAEFALNYLNGGEKRAKIRRREFSSLVSPGTNDVFDHYVLDPLWRHSVTFKGPGFDACNTEELLKYAKSLGTATNGLGQGHLNYLVPTNVDSAIAVNSATIMLFCIGIVESLEQIYAMPAVAAFVCVTHIRQRKQTKTVGYGITGLHITRNVLVFCDDKMEHTLNEYCNELASELTQLKSSAELIKHYASSHVRVSCAEKPCTLITTLSGMRQGMNEALKTPERIQCKNLCSQSFTDQACKQAFLHMASGFVSVGGSAQTSAMHSALRIVMQSDLLPMQQFNLPKSALCSLRPTHNMFDSSVIALAERYFNLIKHQRTESFIDPTFLGDDDMVNISEESHNSSPLGSVSANAQHEHSSPENVLPPC